MQLSPKEEDWKLADKVFQRFSAKLGSQHIASKFALAYLSALLYQTKPKKVLEFGAGIGTITYLMLIHPAGPKKIVSTEEHPFCLEQLKKNIPSRFDDILEITNKDSLSEYEEIFDVIIIDSDFYEDSVMNKFNEKTVFFVEGSRKLGRNNMQRIASKNGFILDFVNYNRGRKLIHFALRKLDSGYFYPRIKLFKPIKGCWVGTVKSEGLS